MPQTIHFEANELVKRLKSLPEGEKIFFFDKFFEIWGGEWFRGFAKKRD